MRNRTENPEFDFDSAFEQMMKEKELKTVVVLAHINPDGDAAGSVMGIAHYLHFNYPEVKVIPYLQENLDKGPKRQVLADRVFTPLVKPEIPKEPYAVIVCDNATMERLCGRKLYEHAAASLVIDHHLSNEGYGDVNYTKPSEACAENIFYILNRKKLERSARENDFPNAADYIYLGIVQDTNGFDRAFDTTMHAAEAMMAMGVQHRRIMLSLQTDTLSDILRRAKILSTAKRALGGDVAYIVVPKEEIERKGIIYEEIHSLSGILRDCDDIRLGFTMFEEKPDVWRCSFRSDGMWVNVNELLKPFGGGGHRGAAGLCKKTADPEKLIEEILLRIGELKAGNTKENGGERENGGK